MKKAILATAITCLLTACGSEEPKQQDNVQKIKDSVEIIQPKPQPSQEQDNQEKQAEPVQVKVEELPEVSIEEIKEEVEEVAVIEDFPANDKIEEVDPFKDYSDLTVNVAHEELQKAINQTIEQYEGIVDQIRAHYKEQRETGVSERKTNVNEFAAIKQEQEGVFNANCKEITKVNKKSCNDIKKDINDLENRVGKLEAQISTFVNKVNSQEINKLKGYQAKLKTNISKLLSQASPKDL